MGNLASRQRLRPPSFSRHWHRHTLLGLVDLDLLEGARDPGQCGSQLVLGGLLRVMLGPAGARVALLMHCSGDYCKIQSYDLQTLGGRFVYLPCEDDPRLAWSLFSVICWADWFTTCLVFFCTKLPLALALPNGMQKFCVLTEGSTKFPPVLIPLPLMSEVDALLPDCHPPGGPSLTSEPALDLWLPEDTLRLPELRYMLPSLLPTA